MEHNDNTNSGAQTVETTANEVPTVTPRVTTTGGEDTERATMVPADSSALVEGEKWLGIQGDRVSGTASITWGGDAGFGIRERG